MIVDKKKRVYKKNLIKRKLKHNVVNTTFQSPKLYKGSPFILKMKVGRERKIGNRARILSPKLNTRDHSKNRGKLFTPTLNEKRDISYFSPIASTGNQNNFFSSPKSRRHISPQLKEFNFDSLLAHQRSPFEANL